MLRFKCEDSESDWNQLNNTYRYMKRATNYGSLWIKEDVDNCKNSIGIKIVKNLCGWKNKYFATRRTIFGIKLVNRFFFICWHLLKNVLWLNNIFIWIRYNFFAIKIYCESRLKSLLVQKENVQYISIRHNRLLSCNKMCNLHTYMNV